MSIAQCIVDCPFILTEGAVIERVRRDRSVRLDPHVLHAGFVYEEGPAQTLAQVYRGYLDVGRTYDLPMITFAPTWRANPVRLAVAGLGSARQVNQDDLSFLRSVVDEYDGYAQRVVVGALMGCAGDAYDPHEALPVGKAHQFHRPQACALVDVGAELVVAATLPALSEALGMAQALAEFTALYALSFVLRPSGALLDGTPLHRAVKQIDQAVRPQPLFYMANCVHPSVFERALEREAELWPELRSRVVGLQGNTSARAPEELDDLDHLASAAPADFSRDMVRLYERLGMRVLGGCCGTDERHIAAIAERMVSVLHRVS